MKYRSSLKDRIEAYLKEGFKLREILTNKTGLQVSQIISSDKKSVNLEFCNDYDNNGDEIYDYTMIPFADLEEKE